MTFATELAAVALGGAVGGWLRYRISGLVAKRVGDGFPWGILAVNVSGALLLGVLAGLILSHGTIDPRAPAWTLLAMGLLGSYTTVSSFSLQTAAFLRAGQTVRAAWNVALSFILCLTAGGLGLAAGLLLPGG